MVDFEEFQKTVEDILQSEEIYIAKGLGMCLSLTDLAYKFAEMFATHNPSFDRQAFLEKVLEIEEEA